MEGQDKIQKSAFYCHTIKMIGTGFDKLLNWGTLIFSQFFLQFQNYNWPTLNEDRDVSVLLHLVEVEMQVSTVPPCQHILNKIIKHILSWQSQILFFNLCSHLPRKRCMCWKSTLVHSLAGKHLDCLSWQHVEQLKSNCQVDLRGLRSSWPPHLDCWTELDSWEQEQVWSPSRLHCFTWWPRRACLTLTGDGQVRKWEKVKLEFWEKLKLTDTLSLHGVIPEERKYWKNINYQAYLFSRKIDTPCNPITQLALRGTLLYWVFK